MFFPVAEDESSESSHFVTNEDPSQKLKWQAHLEFTQNQELGELTWNKVLEDLVYKTMTDMYSYLLYVYIVALVGLFNIVKVRQAERTCSCWDTSQYESTSKL